MEELPLCEYLVDPSTARPGQRFEAVARFIRDLVAHRWVKTPQAREKANPKRIYYLSMEFLIGRTLNNNMMNLAAEPLVQSGRAVPDMELGELVYSENMGAYSAASSTFFNGFPPARVVHVNQ